MGFLFDRKNLVKAGGPAPLFGKGGKPEANSRLRAPLTVDGEKSIRLQQAGPADSPAGRCRGSEEEKREAMCIYTGRRRF